MSDEYAYIKVTQDNRIEIKYQDSAIFELSDIQKEINGFLEVVAPALLDGTGWEDSRILCDDEGLFKDLHPNILASALYAGYSPIVGDVIICRQGYDPNTGEADILPFTKSDGEKMLEFITGLRDHIASEKPNWETYPWFN